MSIASERPADPPYYPRYGTFGELLKWHLEWGTCAECSTVDANQRWLDNNFAKNVISQRLKKGSAERVLRGWKNSGRVPSEQEKDRIDRIFFLLFGDDSRLDYWKRDLQDALRRSRGTHASYPIVSKVSEDRSISLSASDFIDSDEKLSIASTIITSEKRKTPLSAKVLMPRSHFLGRDADVEAIVAMLPKSGAATILVQGGPGMGKTELVKVLMANGVITARFGQRRWFIELNALDTAKTISEAAVKALGFDSQNDIQAALDALRGEQALLVLDNLETPYEGLGEHSAIDDLMSVLTGTEGITVIGCTRGIIDMCGISWQRHTLQELSPAAATDMFASISGQWARDDPDLDYLTTALGGVPLAIELIGHRANGRTSLAPLRRKWDEDGVDLLALPNKLMGSLTSFADSVRLSLSSNRLTPAGFRLFSILGALPAGIREEHIHSIMGDAALDGEESLLRVGLLVERAEYLQLLGPVKDYAKRYCTISNEDMSQVVKFYLGLIASLGISIGTVNDKGNISSLISDIENIEFSFCFTLTNVFFENVGEAFIGLSRFISISSHKMNIFKEISDKRFKFGSDIFSWSYVNIVIGDVNFNNGNLEVARRAYKRASMFLGASKHPQFQAEALTKLAEVDIVLGEYDRAKKSILQSRKIYEIERERIRNSCIDEPDIENMHNRISEAKCLRLMGDIEFSLGKYEESYNRLLDSCIYWEDIDQAGIAKGVKGIGDIDEQLGDFSLARQAFEESLVTFRRINCPLWEAHCTAGLGRIDFKEGKYDSARARLETSLRLYQEVGDASGQAISTQHLDNLARLMPYAVK